MLDKRAYTEVFYIINEMSEEMRSKIPEKIIQNIQERMDKDYKFYVDDDNIEEVQLLDDTEKILSVLYTDYFSTEEERKIILNKEKIIANSRKKKIVEKIEVNEIFSKTAGKSNEKDEKKEVAKSLQKISDIKWFKKITSFLEKNVIKKIKKQKDKIKNKMNENKKEKNKNKKIKKDKSKLKNEKMKKNNNRK